MCETSSIARSPAEATKCFLIAPLTPASIDLFRGTMNHTRPYIKKAPALRSICRFGLVPFLSTDYCWFAAFSPAMRPIDSAFRKDEPDM